MNLLLDTCTFLWFTGNRSRLSPRAVTLIEDSGNSLFLSVVSIWEIITKVRIGKLSIAGDIGDIVEEQVTKNSLRLLPLHRGHVLQGRAWPLLHHDPFDRLLICQSLEDGVTIVTPDQHIRQYAVAVDW